MKCAIISIGTELLMGQVLNTNTKYLSEELNKLGVGVYYHHTVGDNPIRLEKLINSAFENVDMIITTGGLGPTQDDLTKEVISKIFNKKLQLHEKSYNQIKSYFKSKNIKMTDNNKKQAVMPQDSIVLTNNYGTAPGFIIEDDNKKIISLPGPPREMKKMFEEEVIKHLKEKSNNIVSKTIRLIGIGESALEDAIIDLIDNQTNPTIATYAKPGQVSIRITASDKNRDKANEMVDKMVQVIDTRLSRYIYSFKDEELIDIVGNELIKRNKTISLAESCTGGMIAANLTDISGISKVFDRGLVTYSNKAKEEELGVKYHILEEFGAVSRQTAEEMVLGLKNKTNSDICLSVTGIAGPGGGCDKKPVGLVYISIIYDDVIVTRRFNFAGDRKKIRENTLLNALNMIREVFL